MLKTYQIVCVCVAIMMGCAVISEALAETLDFEELKQQVANTERAFAKTMADRDHEAFASFLSEEAIFFSGATALRGKQTIATAWKPFYESSDVPFSWAPELVEVLDSGTLALSSGPVYDAGGKLVGTFNSIWRREVTGEWRVIFDKGSDVCD